MIKAPPVFFNPKPTIGNNDKNAYKKDKFLRANKRCLYKDNKEDRELVLYHLQNIINRKKKSLVYYTVFGDNYRDIYEYSIKSIRHFSDATILAITDQEDLDCDIRILQDSVNDFIDASIKKLDIFEILGNDIFEYDNVLFLDADVIAINDLIFLEEPLNDKIQVVKSGAYSTPRTSDFENNFFHGLKIPLTEEQIEHIIINNYAPFNAGQFLFKPTKQLKDHFNNIRWLIGSWPGYYFYEQGFMNYYCCVLNALVDYNILNPITELCNLNHQHTPKGNGALIHFIGSQLQPETKLNAMKDAYERFI